MAKNHYLDLGSHVTLRSEELIGKFTFDNSTNRDSKRGSNNWRDSGMHNAIYGLRPWLNSSGVYENNVFIPSCVELEHKDYENLVGKTYPYFFGMGNLKR